MAVEEWTVYVAATDLFVDKASSIDDTVEGRTKLVENAKPGIYALDLATGGLVWEIHPLHVYQGFQKDSLYSASLSVTNDVFFAASLDGVVKAFSTLTGSELWSLDTAIAVTDVNGVQGNGGTIDSVGVVIAGEKLLINSGYDSFGGAGEYQAGTGNTLFIMTLPNAPE
jgi:polyvinyl alcohol dehydrogenase (cytochrome)